MPRAAAKKKVDAAPAPAEQTPPASDREHGWLVIRGARHHNLRNVNAAFPLGRFTCVTGVSGSGKSSLVNDILYHALHHELMGATTGEVGDHDAIEGVEQLDKIIAIDQTPIGRTPRSNPSTYIKLFDEIRTLFAKLPDAKLRGYKPGRFSFNVPQHRGGGRCEACEGNGANKIEMDFLADVWVECPVCSGHRFNRETLQIRYKGKSISDVLEMDVQQALDHFENVPRLKHMLQTLHDVGLDYVKLGQSSTTLSGGEAQRIKLARELVKKSTGSTLYVLDEPTTGLHFEDVRRLLAVLHGFVDAGNTVVVIEHNLDVIKTADWLIDLGPEGGAGGGKILVAGTPEDVAVHAGSYTGRALAEELGRAPRSDVESRGVAEDFVAADSERAIRVRGAREHNLRDVDLAIPRDAVTVCTGVSGSGKTSFAIDTVFTEGYRRYVESLSAYARQFLGQMAKPRVDHIEGLSPAICIEQKAASKSPRSTVGTVTEIYDYMRVLWARAGQPMCPRCELPIGAQTIDEISDRVLKLDEGTPIIVLAPVAMKTGETYAALCKRLKQSGYRRVRIDGDVRPVEEAEMLDARRKHRVEVVIDRAVVRPKSRGRIVESIEHALALGGGLMGLVVESVERAVENGDDPPRFEHTKAEELLFSQKLACLNCGSSYEELGPHHFSFNSQLGWCETCEGLGVQRGAPAEELIVQPNKTLFDGAIAGWDKIDRRSPLGRMLQALCRHFDLDDKTPLAEWSERQTRDLLFGGSTAWIDAGAAVDGLRFRWRGFYPAIDNATRNSWMLRHKLRNVVTDIPCVTCRGGRLRPDVAAVRLADRTLVDVCNLTLSDTLAFFKGLRLDDRQKRIAGELLKEIRNRLKFLVDVGLDYVTLHRAAPTLSGGESQRIRLASQIGSGLSGVLYVLDEPTIGLHPRDTNRLVTALHKLRRLGNTLLLVEHDRDVIESADHLVDFGPRAGAFGGSVVAEGPPTEFTKPARRKRSRKTTDADEADGDPSLTRGYLSGAQSIAIPSNRRAIAEPPAPPSDPPAKRSRRAKPPPAPVLDEPHRWWLTVGDVRHNNLRGVTAAFPLGRLTCVTGVSGSGKSSLINDVLWPGLANELNNAGLAAGVYSALHGLEHLDKVINVDQAPIGSTPSSNPATYTGLFDLIRSLFARVPDAKVRGYGPNRFSFNRPGGRCEACEGYGQKCIEMHFMPDVWVECETCAGKRYNPETLEVRYRGKNIADVLDMRVAAALDHFANVPKLKRMLQTLADVGLDYVQLGQPAPTLSGGEAQRVKLATELGKPNTGRTVYLLDEPTTGLHFDDVRKLLDVMHRLVDLGNTVIVVEHNLDVIKSADWIIELGPEAGAAGGKIIATGTPEALCDGSATDRAARLAERRPPRATTPANDAKRGWASSARSRKPRQTAAPLTHTAAAIAPVLEAGPREPRPRFDPQAHASAVLDSEKAGLGDVGKGVKMPWQVDGRKWHLEQRDSRNAAERHWDPQALLYIEALIQKLSGFAPTNWSNQASVEFIAPGAKTWFLHALTGGEWLLECYFQAPRGAFRAARLQRQLKLKTLDERDDIPAYGAWERVDVRERRGDIDAVVVYVHDKAEIDTPAFRKFIREIAATYLNTLANGAPQKRTTAKRKRAKA